MPALFTSTSGGPSDCSALSADRPRGSSARAVTLTLSEREFVTALKTELPTALAHLQRSNIAPVDLAQVAQREELAAAKTSQGRLEVGRKDPRFWPAAGIILDVLEVTRGRVSEAAQALGVSTGNLIGFLQIEPKVWEQANQMRQKFGQKPLRPGD